MYTESEIFARALALECPTERAQFLDGACGDDHGLRARIERELNRAFYRAPQTAVVGVSACCPQCGLEIEAAAPGGLCASCSVRAQQLGSAATTENQPRSSASAADRSPIPSPHDLAPHFPQLELIGLLGSGGMGAVYLARQKSLDRSVALKIIHPATLGSAEFAERFAREAKVLARLNHPHIVGVHEFGAVELPTEAADAVDGPPRKLFYLIMEYVDGTTLRRLVADRSLTPREALAIIPQICEALQFAHDQGIVHRDIKPENILVDRRGRVKIADFGLAKLLSDDPGEFNLTGTHQVMGTPRYMAPEQLEQSRSIDHRADIYSLGVVFYEMLTGELPLGAFQPPSHKVQIDVRLDEVVLRTLAKEPDRRYQHASDVKTDVELFLFDGRAQQSVNSERTSCISELKLAGNYLVALAIIHMVLAVLGVVGLASDIESWGNGEFWRNEWGSGWAWLVPGFITGVLLLVGGINFRRPRSYSLAAIGAFGGLVPLSPLWPISVLFCWWALVVLGRMESRLEFDSVQLRFARHDLAPLIESGALVSQVAQRGIWLTQLGILIAIAGAFLLVEWALVGGDRLAVPISYFPYGEMSHTFWGIYGCVECAMGVLIVAGGISMFFVQARSTATIAAVFGLMPISYGWLLGAPISWWVWTTLRKPKTRQLFQAFSGEAVPHATTAAARRTVEHAIEQAPFQDKTSSAPLAHPFAFLDIPEGRDPAWVVGRLATAFVIVSWFYVPAAFATLILFSRSKTPLLVADYQLKWISLLACIAIYACLLQLAQIAAGRMRIRQSYNLVNGVVLLMVPLQIIAFMTASWAISQVPTIFTVLHLQLVGATTILSLWAWYRLRQRAIQQEWARATVSVEATRAQLTKASTWILAAGSASLGCTIIGPSLYIYGLQLDSHPFKYFEIAPEHWMLIQIVPTSIGVVLSFLQLVGGVNLRRKASFGWSWGSAIIAIINVNPGWLIGLPAGIYTLAVLRQRTCGVKHNSELFASSTPEGEVNFDAVGGKNPVQDE